MTNGGTHLNPAVPWRNVGVWHLVTGKRFPGKKLAVRQTFLDEWIQKQT